MGLPSLNGLMILFSSQTGLIEALLLDKGYLTKICTALAVALAAENLANPEIKTVGIIGAGVQDTAIAVYAFEQATKLNFGKIIEE